MLTHSNSLTHTHPPSTHTLTHPPPTSHPQKIAIDSLLLTFQISQPHASLSSLVFLQFSTLNLHSLAFFFLSLHSSVFTNRFLTQSGFTDRVSVTKARIDDHLQTQPSDLWFRPSPSFSPPSSTSTQQPDFSNPQPEPCVLKF